MRVLFFFLMIRRPPRSTLDRSSAASDVYKRQVFLNGEEFGAGRMSIEEIVAKLDTGAAARDAAKLLSLIHISEPTRPY